MLLRWPCRKKDTGEDDIDRKLIVRSRSIRHQPEDQAQVGCEGTTVRALFGPWVVHIVVEVSDVARSPPGIHRQHEAMRHRQKGDPFCDTVSSSSSSIPPAADRQGPSRRVLLHQGKREALVERCHLPSQLVVVISNSRATRSEIARSRDRPRQLLIACRVK
jgi:hypothetical protein